MKCLFVVILIGCSWITSELVAQDLQIIDGRITMQRVAELPGLEKEVIYQRAKDWFGATRANAQAAIISDTPSELAGKYTRSYTKYDRDFVHHITLEIKDEKLRYTVSLIGGDSYGELESWLLKKKKWNAEEAKPNWKAARTKFRKEVKLALRKEFADLVNDVQFEGLLAIQDTALLEGMKSDVIHEKVKNWFATTHPEGVISSDTPVQISGQYPTSYLGYYREFHHGITIDIEDGQIRYTVTHVAGNNCGDLAAWLIKKRHTDWGVIYRKFRSEVDAALSSDFDDLVKFIQSRDEW